MSVASKVQRKQSCIITCVNGRAHLDQMLVDLSAGVPCRFVQVALPSFRLDEVDLKLWMHQNLSDYLFVTSFILAHFP